MQFQYESYILSRSCSSSPSLIPSLALVRPLPPSFPPPLPCLRRLPHRGLMDVLYRTHECSSACGDDGVGELGHGHTAGEGGGAVARGGGREGEREGCVSDSNFMFCFFAREGGREGKRSGSVSLWRRWRRRARPWAYGRRRRRSSS